MGTRLRCGECLPTFCFRVQKVKDACLKSVERPGTLVASSVEDAQLESAQMTPPLRTLLRCPRSTLLEGRDMEQPLSACIASPVPVRAFVNNVSLI